MVWKKKKKFNKLEKKRLIYSFGFKIKKIFNKYYLAWKKRYIWSFKDSLNFLKKFKKKFISLNIIFNFFVNITKRFYLNNIFLSLKKKKYNIFVRKWIYSLIKILIKNGKKKKVFFIVNYIFLKIKKKVKNLKFFFLKIKKNMHLPLRLRLRIVAGRKLYIPVVLFENKEIMFILRFILLSLKSRNEKSFKDKLLNEFFDVFLNKGLSIKKQQQYNKDIKENIHNIRYLNF